MSRPNHRGTVIRATWLSAYDTVTRDQRCHDRIIEVQLYEQLDCQHMFCYPIQRKSHVWKIYTPILQHCDIGLFLKWVKNVMVLTSLRIINYIASVLNCRINYCPAEMRKILVYTNFQRISAHIRLTNAKLLPENILFTSYTQLKWLRTINSASRGSKYSTLDSHTT